MEDYLNGQQEQDPILEAIRKASASAWQYSDEDSSIWEQEARTGQTTGIQELDQILKLFPGQLNALLGPGTSGKSTFLQQLALVTANLTGRRWLWFAPERELRENLAEFERMAGNERHRAFILESQIHFQPKGQEIAIESAFFRAAGEKIEAERKAGRALSDLVIDTQNNLFTDRETAFNYSESIPFLQKFRSFCKTNQVTGWLLQHAKTRTKFQGKYSQFVEVDDFLNGRMIHNFCDSFLVIARQIKPNEEPDKPQVKTNLTRITNLKSKYSHLYREGFVDFVFNTKSWRYEFSHEIQWDEMNEKYIAIRPEVPMSCFD